MKKQVKRRRKPKRRVRKPVIFILSILFIALFTFFVFKITESGVFKVYDIQTKEEYATYKHFAFAKWKFDSLEDNKNVVIENENGKIMALHNATVNFNTKDVTQNTSYTIDRTNEEGYLNGSYGADGLYLDTSRDGKRVLFKMSGVKAWVPIEDVELYYQEQYYQSYYYIYNSSLIHAILINADTLSYQELAIGPAPNFMKENTNYFSYDGNWYYTDMATLTKDELNQTHENAINKEAYFNFYQYVPHRTLTSLTNEKYNQYLERLGINEIAKTYPCLNNESVLYNLGQIFTDVQNETHINASMMFAVALNESGVGQSQYAIENHNLFGHAAYDENPDNANKYNSLKDCIYKHANNFLQQGYSNPEDERYHGSWFGNKASGINVMYASDPYWAEKAANFYYRLDDQDFYDIQIITKQLENDLNVYDEIDGNVLYTYESGDIVSFVFKANKDGWYRIMSEAPINQGKIDVGIPYSSNDTAYIKTEDIE